METNTDIVNKNTIDLYEDEVLLNKDKVVLFALSEQYGINFQALMLLYEEFGKKIFLILYLFAGIKISIPSEKKFIKLISTSKDILSCLKGEMPSIKLTNKMELVKEKLEKIYDKETNCIKVLYDESYFDGVNNEIAE